MDNTLNARGNSTEYYINSYVIKRYNWAIKVAKWGEGVL